jgi:hypothetical protein
MAKQGVCETMACLARPAVYSCSRKMKTPLGKILRLGALALGLVAFRVPAEEHGGSLTNNLSGTVLSGYIESSVTWNPGTGGTSNLWQSLYLQQYERQQQIQIHQFFLQFQATHGFWNNPQMLQFFLTQDHLRRVPLPISQPVWATNFTLEYIPPAQHRPPWLGFPGVPKSQPPKLLPPPLIQPILGGPNRPPATNSIPFPRILARANQF